MKSPLIPGNQAWSPYSEAPKLVPDRPGLHFAFRRWPAAISVLCFSNLEYAPLMDEEHIWASTRYFIDPERRRRVTTFKIPDDQPENHRQLQEWVKDRGNARLRYWWSSPEGWKSPHERIRSFRSTLERLHFPHLEPFELANFRLPDDISTDLDVIILIARCQGVQRKHLTRDSELETAFIEATARGIEKFCKSRWVQLAIAAPFLRANGSIGVLFPGSSYIDSIERMRHLSRHPFQATEGELDIICANAVFRATFEQARRARAQGAYVNPPGYWYVGGTLGGALGQNFRRGPFRTKRAQ